MFSLFVLTLITLYFSIMYFQQQNLDELRATLRMSIAAYDKLQRLVKPFIRKKHTNWRKPISPQVRLAVTLRFLSLGDGFRSLSQQFRIGLSTVREIVWETCHAICFVLRDDYLKTPTNQEEWMQIAERFKNRWDFPHVLGSVDGKHVRIAKPRRSGSLFYNYKGYFSVVLLAICNADYEFLYVDIGAEGRASDGGTWRRCTFHQYLHNPDNPLNIPGPQLLPGINLNVPYFLVGDEAFKLTPNVMKPFPGRTESRKEQIFNDRLCRCRHVIENTFGILATRFRIFHRSIEVQPNFVQNIVMTCCILHNFMSREARSEYLRDGGVDTELPDGSFVGGEWRRDLVHMDHMRTDTDRNPSVYAKRVRSTLADYFLTPQGEVPWQYDSD